MLLRVFERCVARGAATIALGNIEGHYLPPPLDVRLRPQPVPG